MRKVSKPCAVMYGRFFVFAEIENVNSCLPSKVKFVTNTKLVLIFKNSFLCIANLTLLNFPTVIQRLNGTCSKCALSMFGAVIERVH